ncbi:amino acid aminotransferase [Orrella daihaiensis]|uniref:Aminotransferase n=1 Tax=Orrella daihaiensis TaxID=2782176 RepID=A0ABY4AG94_9BURK|nr:amino acid aminotransferase [Orrella daihaiensis]UOD49272.1 aspartate/tyrosine/aromatic aminotransferase [Orrella daihaiensis]
MSTLFEAVELAPRDPILGLNEQYNADERTGKVNLGVGVYYDDQGRVPLLKCVHQAEVDRVQAAGAHSYLPIEGLASLNKAARELLLGKDSEANTSGRAFTVQALGGTGALKIGADYLKQLLPNAKVAISAPSWENHRALFERAGFDVVEYAYYDPQSHGLNLDGMLASLKALPDSSIVVLHACCHNPTGVDPTPAQWQQIADTIKEKNHISFLDIAYQGFGDGLVEDAAAVRMFVQMGLTCLISTSFSKSFSLYGERIGALTVVTSSADEAKRVLSQVKRVIRTNYSNPPTFGGAVVAEVLNSEKLFALWDAELAQMRSRIKEMRDQLVSKLQAAGVAQNFDFVLTQKGMFSYSGLTASQVDRLREEHGIYAVSSGRICVAALNSQNIDGVVDAIASVLKK